MKKAFFLSFLILCIQIMAQDITGFWTTVNEKTKKPESIIAIYEYKGKYYGRIIGTYDLNTGKIGDTIYNPVERAPGVVGQPFYSGLDIIYNLMKGKDNHYNGRIIDPQEGKSYRAEIWSENGNLMVQGKLFFFWRTQTWPPFPDKDFNKDFPKPDVSKFVPKIPKLNQS